MKTICEKLGFALLVLGLIGSFLSAYLFGYTSEISYFGNIETERSWSLTIAIFICGLLSTITISSILLGISEILEKLDKLKTIYMNTPPIQSEIVGINQWKCACGKINPHYTGTCSCGRTKDK